MNHIFYIYFDLRKYSFIDKNYPPNEQFVILSKMHQKIESEMEKNDGVLYHLQLDTAVYYIPQPEKTTLTSTLKKIKSEIDRSFDIQGIPSTLHISCVYGKSSFGKITLNKSQVFNILGEVTNFLQQTIYATESEEGRKLFDSICFHDKAAKEVGYSDFSGKVSINNIDFYYLL